MYPSGNACGFTGIVSQGRSVEFHLSDMSAFLDPGSEWASVAETEVTMDIELVGISVPAYETAHS